MNSILSNLENIIIEIFETDSTGHDIYHLGRVKNIALKIQKEEGGDKLIIAVSALVHDIHRIIQNKTKQFCSPKDSLPKVKEVLQKVDLSKSQVKNILHCVEFHEEYNFSKNGKTVTDIETLILQDADNLDAIGAIGIARTFMYGGSHSEPMWLPEINTVKETYDESDNDDPSVIHHFYSKLLKLKDNMNTKTGKIMATHRHNYMLGFIDQFKDEWEGFK
ncbi:MAG: HD domain-containing protein [Ignavibacteria bacterium]|jgi:uncharacterized protein